MYRLWVREIDQPVWHDGLKRLKGLEYQATCGWTVNARHASLWPQKTGDDGPSDDERCHACVAARLIV